VHSEVCGFSQSVTEELPDLIETLQTILPPETPE